MSLRLLLCFVALLPAAQARVLRLETRTRTDVLGGKSFGSAGTYERLTGKVYFTVAVRNAHNRRIVDLDHAKNLKDGEVEFSADFVAVQPKEPKRGNGSLLMEVPNRGHSRIVSLLEGGSWDVSEDAGDAWFLRNGFSFLAIGWQWDATGADALRLYAPVAQGANQQPITGLLRGDLMPSKVMDEIPLGHLITGNIGGAEYPVSAPEDPRNQLTVRDSRDAARRVIPRFNWQFAHLENGKLVPSNRHIHLEGGFQPGKIYEYVYAVQDPVIAGLGFAAVRDIASYIKYGTDRAISAQRVYGEGISQDGRFLRDFLYEGFNADENGRLVLDGVLAHVAGAGRGSFNYRFAQPSRDAQPTSSIFFPTDIFPFSDDPERDPQSSRTEGLLDPAKREHVVPKIFFSNTSYEYWGRAASLIHMGPDGRSDLPVSENVRIYHLTGLQHFSGPFPPEKGTGDLLGIAPESPLPVRFFWRAMLSNMDAWVKNGTTPPPSAYPTMRDGTLVEIKALRFPAIPGVHVPQEANRAYHVDFGPNWERGILSRQPPQIGSPFAVRVPQVDVDGNETDGVRLPEIAVPLATYTGWNFRDPSIGAPNERVSFEGSFLPFPKTVEQRKRSGDPRRSIAERYRDRDDYLSRFANAIDALIKQRWILQEDRAALQHRGEAEWDLLTGAR